MHVWNVLHAARCKCRTQNSRQKSQSGHHRTTLSGYIFATKTRIDNRKQNLLGSNISSTCPHNMVNFGPLAAEIISLVWGTPGNFNGFRVLAALLHGTLVVGVSQTLRRWTEGTTYIRQGGHHVRHWPTFLVVLVGGLNECSRCRLIATRARFTASLCWSTQHDGLWGSDRKVADDKCRHGTRRSSQLLVIMTHTDTVVNACLAVLISAWQQKRKR